MTTINLLPSELVQQCFSFLDVNTIGIVSQVNTQLQQSALRFLLSHGLNQSRKVFKLRQLCALVDRCEACERINLFDCHKLFYPLNNTDPLLEEKQKANKKLVTSLQNLVIRSGSALIEFQINIAYSIWDQTELSLFESLSPEIRVFGLNCEKTDPSTIIERFDQLVTLRLQVNQKQVPLRNRDFIPLVFKKPCQVTKLYLVGYGSDLVADPLDFFNNFPNLVELHYEFERQKTVQLTAETFSKIRMKTMKLERLTLVLSLNLQHSLSEPPASPVELFPNLKYLDLNLSFKDPVIENCFTFPKNVEEYCIHEPKWPYDSQLTSVLRKSQFKKLTLVEHASADDLLPIASETLEILELHACDMSLTELHEWLINCPALTTLKMKGLCCFDPSPSCTSHSYPAIRTLILDSPDFIDRDNYHKLLEMMKHSLTTLRISNPGDKTSTPSSTSIALPCLRDLTLKGIEASLLPLFDQEYPNLRTLTLKNCAATESEVLEILRKQPSLENCTLGGVVFTTGELFTFIAAQPYTIRLVDVAGQVSEDELLMLPPGTISEIRVLTLRQSASKDLDKFAMFLKHTSRLAVVKIKCETVNQELFEVLSKYCSESLRTLICTGQGSESVNASVLENFLTTCTKVNSLVLDFCPKDTSAKNLKQVCEQKGRAIIPSIVMAK